MDYLPQDKTASCRTAPLALKNQLDSWPQNKEPQPSTAHRNDPGSVVGEHSTQPVADVITGSGLGLTPRSASWGVAQRRYLLLTVLALGGLALRCYGIGRLNFWYDEILLWDYSLTGYPLYTPTEPPLMAWLLYLVMWWVRSADTLWLHFVPALLGTATILVTFWVTARISQSARTAWLAALLLTLSPMAIYYSREGRPYALFILVSLCLYASFWRARTSTRWTPWLLYAGWFFLSALSHTLTTQIAVVLGLVVLAEGATAVLAKHSMRLWWQRCYRWLLCSACAGMLGSVWFLYRYWTDPAIQANKQRIFHTGTYLYGVPSFLHDALMNLGPGPVGPRLGKWHLGWPEVGGLLWLLLFLVGLWQLYKQRGKAAALLVALAVAVPLGIDYQTLGEKSSWDWMRWMSHALVPYVIGVSMGLQAVWHWARQWYVQTGLLVLLFGSVLPPVLAFPERPEYQRHRDIVRYVQEHAGDLQGVLILPARPEIPSPADPRILDMYFYLRRDTLPVYLASFGGIKKPQLVPSRGHITQVPRESEAWESQVPSGNYAVLTQLPLQDCKRVPPTLTQVQAVARQSTPIMRGLTVCDFDFSR